MRNAGSPDKGSPDKTSPNGASPGLAPYDYAVVRVVPRVDRGEFVNVGVILSCPKRDFLDARIELDEGRLRALDDGVDLEAVREQLDAIPRLCAGGQDLGPVGRMSRRERFHWLVAPRSTVIQMSPAHTGCCADPAEELERLMGRLVRVAKA